MFGHRRVAGFWREARENQAEIGGKKYPGKVKTVKVFKDLFNNKSRKYPSELVANLIKESSKPILKIKNYHNRERPNVVAKNFGINLPYVKMSSAQTAAFPSGHSAQAFLIKEVLTDMYPEMNPLFVKAADNISKSRIVANVHYNSDKAVGERLGIDLYNHLKNI